MLDYKHLIDYKVEIMVNSIIGEIYNSFSNEELKQLDLFMQTSQWQYRDTVFKCHECILEFRSRDALAELDKSIIFSYIYEEEKYNDSKLRFVLNRLVEAIREFILLSQNAQKNVFTEKVWMDFLLEKKLRKNIQYNIDKTTINASSEYRFLHQYFKSQESNIQILNLSRDVKQRFQSFTDLIKHADLYSDLVFIKNYCSLVNFTNVFQSTQSKLSLEKLNEIKAKGWHEIYPEFMTYISLIDLLIDRDNTDKYYTFKENLFNHFDIWNDDEKNNFLVGLLNFNTNQINKGNISFIDEQYDLYQLFEEKNIFKIKNYINSGRINNVVHIYLRKKEFKKSEEFVSKYVPLLPEESRDSCRHFNLARILFEKSNYKNSLRELLRVDFSQDAFYSLNSKLLLLKNYFELKESDAFDSLCTSFKEFIRKNKVISETHKTYYLNFIKTLKKLYGANNSKLKSIKSEIESNHQLAEKNWLLEKSAIISK